MLTWSIVSFAVGAGFGLTMAVAHFKGRSPPPAGLAVLHGIFVALGAGLLATAVFVENLRGGAAIALGLFVLAALGGLTMALGFHARRKPLPSLFVLGHGSLAVAAFLILLAARFGPP